MSTLCYVTRNRLFQGDPSLGTVSFGTENDDKSLDSYSILCRAPLIIPYNFLHNDSSAHSISSITIQAILAVAAPTTVAGVPIYASKLLIDAYSIKPSSRSPKTPLEGPLKHP